MDDRFLESMRREPPATLARDLRARLRAQEEPRRRWTIPAPAMAAAAAVAVVVALFTFPSVRVSAQAVLDLFRVRHFAAVPFDTTRFDRLRAIDHDQALMVFDKKEVLHDPGPPQAYSDPGSAGAAAGLALRQPGFLPSGFALDSVWVEGAGAMRFTVSSSRLRTMLDRLDLRDVEVPSGIDGRTVEVHKPPIVIERFKSARSQLNLIQAQSPEVSLPAGVDLARLAEMGLRILGLDAGEARRIAQATDWRTTLLVPVPINASTFRQVTIRGEQGLLITTTDRTGANAQHPREGMVLMWSEGNRVFGLTGRPNAEDMVQIAESLR